MPTLGLKCRPLIVWGNNLRWTHDPSWLFHPTLLVKHVQWLQPIKSVSVHITLEYSILGDPLDLSPVNWQAIHFSLWNLKTARYTNNWVVLAEWEEALSCWYVQSCSPKWDCVHGTTILRKIISWYTWTFILTLRSMKTNEIFPVAQFSSQTMIETGNWERHVNE